MVKYHEGKARKYALIGYVGELTLQVFPQHLR